MDNLTNKFSIKSLSDFFKKRISSFKSETEDINHYIEDKDFPHFSELTRVGNASFKNFDEIIVFACRYNGVLSERSSKKKQFEIAKLVLKEDFKDGAIFVFYNESGKFRFSFIRRNWNEKSDKKYSSWKRFTYFIDPKDHNKTFRQGIGNCTFKDLDSIQEAFSVEKLTKEFYNDLFKWYQWTLTPEVGVTFPNNTVTSEDDRVKLEEQIIRLITRLLFVWFIKQKHLVPDELFKTEKLSKILKDFDPNSYSNGSYYNAIVQNLFFATLNKAVPEREFAKQIDKRDIKTRYRYAEMFNISEKEVLELFRTIPFLNGGLFECLDKEKSTDGIKYHLDGFSRNAEKAPNGNFKHRAFIPNCVFFHEEKGLIPLLKRYNFTIEENVPNEVQVALDPELLGNVFENLLGAFNPETQESARKQSGSFYTPKEIVAYMIDESLIAFLNNALSDLDEELIRQLFEQETLPDFLTNDPVLCEKIASQLRSIKILDPACGSGAFPMGVLNRMVEILEKLDVKNKESHYNLKLHLIEECIYGVDIQTIAVQISKLRFFISLIVEQEAMNISKPDENYAVLTLPNLETKFVAANTLIGLENENSSLLDLTDKELKILQKKLLTTRHQHFYAKSTSEKVRLRKQDEELRNDIVEYLSQHSTKPNVEKIKANQKRVEELQLQRKAYETENWVEDFQKEIQTSMFDEQPKQASIFRVDLNEKPRIEIDRIIKALQTEITKEENKSQKTGFEKTIEKIAQWNPYDQNASSPFFDREWMFGLEEGFDIVIGNPPYVQLQKESGRLAKLYQHCGYKTFAKTGDIYSLFYERGWQLLKNNGFLCYITSNKWMRAGYGENTREFFATNTNPILLIDFAGQKIFESATVDTNILLFSKDKNRQQTRACVIKEKVLNNLSVYFRQNATVCNFLKSESWVVLSEIEKRIKAKIEAVGVPLKDWDINIYRGILTGYNEAFIIDGKKKDELITEDPKSAEIIRPLLNDRAINKYLITFEDKYLINAHNGDKKKNIKPINLEKDYPMIYKHILEVLAQINSGKIKRKRGHTNSNKSFYNRSDQGETPFNLRNCTYLEKFNYPKIVWKQTSSEKTFAFDDAGYFLDVSGQMLTCDSNSVQTIKYLLAFMNSKIIDFYIRIFATSFGTVGIRWIPQFIELLPIIPQTDENIEYQIEIMMERKDYEAIDILIYKMYNLTDEEILFIEKL